MKKLLLTGIATLFLATGTAPAIECAKYSGIRLQQCIAKETDLIELPASPPLDYKKEIDIPYDPQRPPPEFDHAFQGTVEILESANPCGDGDLFKVGCMTYIQREPYPLCHIEMAKRRIIEAMGGKYDDVLRHEIGHCNGWKHSR